MTCHSNGPVRAGAERARPAICGCSRTSAIWHLATDLLGPMPPSVGLSRRQRPLTLVLFSARTTSPDTPRRPAPSRARRDRRRRTSRQHWVHQTPLDSNQRRPQAWAAESRARSSSECPALRPWDQTSGGQHLEAALLEEPEHGLPRLLLFREALRGPEHALRSRHLGLPCLSRNSPWQTVRPAAGAALTSSKRHARA
jgi:hypothetical protein